MLKDKENHSITMVLLDVDPQILLFLIFEQVSSEQIGWSKSITRTIHNVIILIKGIKI